MQQANASRRVPGHSRVGQAGAGDLPEVSHNHRQDLWEARHIKKSLNVLVGCRMSRLMSVLPLGVTRGGCPAHLQNWGVCGKALADLPVGAPYHPAVQQREARPSCILASE